jgi:hypothetical protein
LKEPLLFLIVLKHCKNPGLLGSALAPTLVLFFIFFVRLRSSLAIITGQTAATVHQISKLATSKLRTLYSENK